MTPVALAEYREQHVIRVIKDWDEDWGRFIFRCEHDHIRVHRKSPTDSDSSWVHDQADIANLARLERGESIQW